MTWDYVLMTLAIAATGWVSLGIRYFFNRLAKKAEAEAAKIESDQFRQEVQDAIHFAQDLASDVVSEIHQTLVADLKKARQDGKLTEEEKQKFLTLAINKIKDQMSLAVMESLTYVVDDVDDYLHTLVESNIEARKRDAEVFGAGGGGQAQNGSA